MKQTENEIKIEIPSSPTLSTAEPRVPSTSNNLPDIYVGARRLLKNTPWMSPMSLGFISAAILALPGLSIWFIHLDQMTKGNWNEILSRTPSLLECYRWSLMASLFAFFFFMSLTLYTLAPLGTKYSANSTLKRFGQVVGIVRHNLAFFTASFVSLTVYLNLLNKPLDEKIVAETAKLASAAAIKTGSTTGGDIFVGSLSAYLDSIVEVIMKRRESLNFIPYVLFLLSATLLIEKLVIIYISHNFHKSFYTERIRRNNMVLSSFETLSILLPPSTHRPIRPGAVLKNDAVALYAESIFNGLVKSDRDSLIIDDFLEEIDHPIATELFKYLDFNQSGDISLSEFKEAMQESYEEKRVLLKSIKANEVVINRIDKFFATIIILYKLSCFLPKLKIDFLSTLGYLGLSTFFLRHVLDHFIKQLFNSVMHFLVTHPYDVGDKIQMNHKNYRIKDMGFWKTTLISSDGKVSYVPNHTLFRVKFGNYRRSDKMESNILMSMNLETSKDAIYQYTAAINEFIKENGKYFDHHVVIKEVVITNSDSLNIIFGITHKFNFNNDDNLHFRCGLIFDNMAKIANEQNLKYYALRFQEE